MGFALAQPNLRWRNKKFMKLLESKNVIADLIMGGIFFGIGAYTCFYRRKVVTALLVSNQEFWSKFNLPPNNNTSVFITTIMISLMGFVFLGVGLFMVAKGLISVFK